MLPGTYYCCKFGREGRLEILNFVLQVVSQSYGNSLIFLTLFLPDRLTIGAWVSVCAYWVQTLQTELQRKGDRQCNLPGTKVAPQHDVTTYTKGGPLTWSFLFTLLRGAPWGLLAHSQTRYDESETRSIHPETWVRPKVLAHEYRKLAVPRGGCPVPRRTPPNSR
jgi:hypothetical protein